MEQRGRTFKTLVSFLVILLFGVKTMFAVEIMTTRSTDFTGPYAVIAKPIEAGIRPILAWWNDTKGKELGVTVKAKTFESRYDPSVVASTWPGILVSEKPVFHLGIGGPDVAALMKRLPKDKVPLYNSTAIYGFIWKPNQWVFSARPTYAHETAGFLAWMHENVITDRPIRIAAVNSKVSPAYVDMVNGVELFCKNTPWVEFVGTEWVKMKPVSLISETRRLGRLKPDIIWIGTNTSHVVAVRKAEKSLGLKIPVLMFSHNGIAMTSRAAKDMKLLEGCYDVIAGDPGIDPTVKGAQIIRKYAPKVGLEPSWSILTTQVILQQLVPLRALERAIAKVGKNNVTGQDIYNAMFEGAFTSEQMLNLSGDLKYTKNAPFPETNVKVKVTTVRNGKHVLASKNWVTIPPVQQWAK